MKEKIKKAFKKITPDLVMMWFNIAVFAYHIILSIKHDMWEIAMIGVPFLIIALLAFDLHRKEKKIRVLVNGGAVQLLLLSHAVDELKRYKKLYGELPPEEEPSEQEESEKQEKKDEDENKNE